MKFKMTHPWIGFRLDLRQAPWGLWLELGEAASKCEHLAGVPLQPEVARRLHEIFLAKGAAATTAIEGNTLSEEQVLQHLRGQLKLPPSQEYLQREVENIVRACNRIVREIVGPTATPVLSPALIRDYNREVLRDLKLGEDVVPGEVRHHSVVVGGVYRGAPAEDCDYLLDRMCQWLNQEFSAPDPVQRLPFALLKAVMAHLYLAWIHPFGDGNGRTARLVEFHVLLEAGVPLPAAHLLSDHYNRTRTEYYRQLDAASKSGGDVLPFIRYAIQGFVDGLRQQIETVREQQWQVMWEHHVHEVFCSRRGSDTHKRRRDLVLALGKVPDWVDVAGLDVLTPELAKAYARKTERTLQRDLNEIARTQLIERQHGKVRACREIILAFLPARAAGA
jgi:Fic family protein